MLLLDAPLTFQEFMTHETVPLSEIFRELLTLLGRRSDAVLFGAQAVNAYCEPARMTEDIDVVSTDAPGLAEAIRVRLSDHFHIAVRIREVAGGLRVYQLRQPKNRHLCDIRAVDVLPASREIEGVRVVTPAVLAGMKATSMVARAAREKGLSDKLDLVRLVRTFPELRDAATIRATCDELGAPESVVHAWTEVASLGLGVEEDDP